MQVMGQESCSSQPNVPGSCPGSPVIARVLPSPTACTHSNIEDSGSVEYKMALLNCLVMRVGFIVMSRAFLPSSYSVLRHTFLT